jgi:ribosome-binding protein aMBF1 (putative translation factor)
VFGPYEAPTLLKRNATPRLTAFLSSESALNSTLVFHPARLQETTMLVGERLRMLREEKKLSQGEIEKRTGLLRCYISRVENGHTVPAIETLEKMARAMEIPMPNPS